MLPRSIELFHPVLFVHEGGLVNWLARHLKDHQLFERKRTVVKRELFRGTRIHIL
jgi:diadenosine tetraphosphatase ApaH/serine/threonine PP2A family protein phosphatase